MPSPITLPAWTALGAHHTEVATLHLRALFAEDPERFPRFSLQLGELLFDFSKNRITDQTLRLLVELAEQAGLAERIHALLSGAKVNGTEKRAALHTALRNRSNRPIRVDGTDVMPEVNRVLEQMRLFCADVHEGRWLGHSGRVVRDVVNLGIGGSDLGPRMAVKALRPYWLPHIRVHFVSNVDGADLLETLDGLDPETTLFLVASKTFSTLETMANAHSARRWFLDRVGDERAIARHFIALSTNRTAVVKFGIDPANMFEFWDWVGGRYSLWSAIGLPIALAVGMRRFEEMLEGAHRVDEHFASAPFSENIPVLMGLIGLWYVNFFGADSTAVLPYDHSLSHLPAFLQQLDMESNGKGTDQDGAPVGHATGPVVWGQPGTCGQHAFYQLIHQGTPLVPCDFLAAASSPTPLGEHHTLLLANLLAQSEALMLGRTEAEARTELIGSGVTEPELTLLARSRVFPGNRPSNVFLYPRLTPETLGMLLALYEHKVFVQGSLWNINSFDQMGVELGKRLARTIATELEADTPQLAHDASTNGLIRYLRATAG